MICIDDLFDLVQETNFTPSSYQYFHQLLDNRTVVFNEEIKENILEKVYLPLRDFELDDSDRPVTLILSSIGGSISDSFFLAYYIARYKKKLNIIVTGSAASMATILRCGGGKNDNVTRYCFPCSYGLLHDGSVTLAASEAKTASDIMAFNDCVDKQIKEFIIENTNITEELYDSKSRHQWFLSSKEMKDLNIIDKIYGVDE